MVRWSCQSVWGCFEGSRGLSEIIFCTCFGRLIHTNEGDGGMGNLILLYFCLNNNKIRNAHLTLKIYLYHILNREKNYSFGDNIFCNGTK